MKNTVKWIITAVLLIGVIVGAVVLYNSLSEEYKVDNLQTSAPQETDEPTETSESANGDGEQSDPPAPDFTVTDYNGNKVNLSDYIGKPVVLNFWATWCYYCKEEMPDFDEASKLYPDVQFLMVNATDGVRETVDAAKKYVEENGFDFEVFFDTELDAVNTYYVTSFPQTYFINAEGKLIARGNGMLDLETLKQGISMITE